MVILDPWLEPLPTPLPVPYTIVAPTGEAAIKSSLEVMTSFANQEGGAPTSVLESSAGHSKMLVINSETFTLWKDHYACLKEIMAGWGPNGGRILTLGARSNIYQPQFLTDEMVCGS